ncbi:MAG: type II toxin-antitoxin system VapC family toxin [Candidatus Hydrogenedentota bacterium]
MIVVDTNVIASLFISGPETLNAKCVLQRDSEWSAPLLWRSEMQNVLSKYMRRDGMAIEKAVGIMQNSRTLPGPREYESSPESVLGLVASSSCSAYDCEFVALAQQLEVPLVTADIRILRDFPGIVVALREFARR